jgi:hypothetical protein
MNIEQDLHRALTRKTAQADFADKVLTRIEREQPGRGTWIGRQARWLAAAAAVVLLAGGGARYYEQQRQAAEAERLKQEIRAALQITSDVLARAQTRIQESGNRR